MYDDAFQEFGNWLGDKLRAIFLILSVGVSAGALWCLHFFEPTGRTVIGILIVLFSSGIAIYWVWLRLIFHSFWVELLLNEREQTFWRGQYVRGRMGFKVGRQIWKAVRDLIIGYIFVGLVFGITYSETATTNARTVADNIYFSFVTFGTIGYGDIQPTGAGKILVCIESVIFLLYQVVAITAAIAIVGKITAKPKSFGYDLTPADDTVETSKD